MTKAPVVVIFVPFFLPGFKGGGPVRSVANIVQRLGHEFAFSVVTSDCDFQSLNSYVGVNSDEWNLLNGVNVFYSSSSGKSFFRILKIIRSLSPEAIYLNGFFDLGFTFRVLLLRRLGFLEQIKVILAPRGELSVGALGIKSFKKSAYIAVQRIFGLTKNLIWHASTELEAQEIRDIIRSTEAVVFVAENIPARSEASFLVSSNDVSLRKNGAQDSRLKICFLSRISPKKNLKFALRVLAEVKSEVTFDIFGPKEDLSYWGECDSVIAVLPGNVSVRYCGALEHEMVPAALRPYDVFFLPTLGENFGHVFIEAWAAGLKVLTSDRTPWRDLRQSGLGWDISLDCPKDFVDAIDSQAEKSLQQRALEKERCFVFAAQKSESIDALEKNVDLFKFAVTKK